MIRVLPPALQNQIAAGEVVERPASVVKELLENSLDAGASRIRIAIEAGGRSRILIQDDGVGMAPQELPLAVTRHATSKIASADDLSRITSLGFRGEALPSIGAVARLSITSIQPDAVEAARILVEFGEILEQQPAALPRGTHVEVRDLFANIPARLKFLKTMATESKRCREVVERLALAHLDKDLELEIGGRPSLRFLSGQSLSERLKVLWPERIVASLLPVRHASGGAQVTGLAGSPDQAQGRPDRIFFYVNQRPVKDPVLLKALREAYKGRLLSRESPQAVLFLTLPLQEVDVNVHPAKTEVRFRDKSMVFSLVRSAIRLALDQALGQGGTLRTDSPADTDRNREGPPPKLLSYATFLEETKPGLREDYPQQRNLPPVRPDRGAPRPAANLPGREELHYLGQIDDTYLVCRQGTGNLVLVDQHAAHERVLFAAYKRGGENDQAQLLALPMELSLHPAEQTRLQSLSQTLRGLGFSFELPKPGLMVVRTIPSILSSGQARAFLQEALSGQAEDLDDLWTMMACRTAIKAGDRLSTDEAVALLEAWQSTRDSHHCPHGRPVAVRFSPPDLERLFKRR
ncbi:MAG: DNA mismatch repair endonuclease MutL [Desulfovibrionales bacterium]